MYKPINMAVWKDASQIAAGDTRNQLIIRLLDKDGAVKNLTGITVTWSGRDSRGKNVVINRAAQVFAGGEVGIKFLPADTPAKGAMYIQFRVAWSGTEIEYFPADNKLFLLIT